MNSLSHFDLDMFSSRTILDSCQFHLIPKSNKYEGNDKIKYRKLSSDIHKPINIFITSKTDLNLLTEKRVYPHDLHGFT